MNKHLDIPLDTNDFISEDLYTNCNKPRKNLIRANLD
jgi:hypothetical protein